MTISKRVEHCSLGAEEASGCVGGPPGQTDHLIQASESVSWMFAEAVPTGMLQATLKVNNFVLRLQCWHGATTVAVPEGYCLWPGAVVLAQQLPAILIRRTRVLDLGCGCGLLSIVAAKLGCQVVLADNNPNVLFSALQNCRDNDVTPDAVLVEDWNRPRFLVENQFDVVISSDTFYPLPEHDYGEPMVRHLLSCAPNCYLSVSGSEYATKASAKIGTQLLRETRIPFPSSVNRKCDCFILHAAGVRQFVDSVVGSSSTVRIKPVSRP